MEGRLFTLVTADDQAGIFAWGMEITDGDDREAVIFRRDPDTRQATHGVHDSAEAARVLHSRLVGVGLVLVWMDFRDELQHLNAMLDPEPVLIS